MVLFGSGGRNARLIGTALLIATFSAGALAGAALVRVVSAERPEMRRHEPGPPRGGPRRLLLDEQFTKELGLTAEQHSKILAILDRRDAEAKRMWNDFEPRLKKFAEATRREIGAVLTDDQQNKLDAAVEQRRALWKKQRHSGPRDSSNAANQEKAQ
jgi:Spy/CpxP family protein refolding chaperone